MEIALILIFIAGAIWMFVTTPDQRRTIFGYMIAVAVIASIVSLITGQGPNSHY